MSEINRSQRSMNPRSVREKRTDLRSQRGNLTENRSIYGGSRHYQRTGGSQMTATVRTSSSIATEMISICGKSDFCEELAKIAQYDNVKANLMWNNFLNDHMLNMKKQKSQEDKDKDKRFAKQVEDKMKREIEREKQKQKDKLKVYKDAMLNQRDDHLRKAEREKNKKNDENDKIKEMLANRDDSIRRQEMMDKRKQKYQRELADQRRDKARADRDASDLRREISARNRNYLIDDTWKQKHKDDLKDHFKNGLINQIQDKNDEKNWDKRQKEIDDEQYREDLRNAENADLKKRKQIQDAKRDIFVNEIKNQQDQKKRQQELDRALSNAEDDKVRQKLHEDHMRHTDAEKKKMDLLNEHLKKVEDQLRDINDRKKKALKDHKKPYGTTLLTKGDYVNYEPDLQANLDMVADKRKRQQRIYDEDREFADEVKKRNHDAIERDRQKEAEKLKVYKDAMLNQRDDHLRKAEREKEKLKAEDEKWKNDVNRDNARFYKKLNDADAKKRNDYQRDLNSQRRNKALADQEASDLRREISARNRNYLIDDTWKQKHKDDLKDHFKNGLINQIQDKNDEKNWDRRQKEIDDEQYRDDLRNAENADLKKRKEIEAAKRDIFVNEIKNQQDQKKRQQELDRALSNAEDDKVRQKLIEDHMRYLDGEKKKKAVLDEHLGKVSNQLKERELKNKQEKAKAKMKYGTTLLTRGDNVKYFDYLDCMQMYPLRKLQKLKKMKMKMDKEREKKNLG